jgi:hypothetical protein
MRRTLVLLATLLAASLFSVQPSRAQFAVCSDEYVDSFRVLASAGGFSWYPGQLDCHEFWRDSFSTPAGTRWIRLIGDSDGAGAQRLPPGGVDEIREAARRATRLMRSIGPYAVDNITMMIGPFAADTAGAVHGVIPAAFRTSAPEKYNECHITLTVATGYSGATLYHVIAHEIFHCVEEASLSAEQFATLHQLGAWWGEGAAHAFGAVAARERSRYDHTASFATAVRNRQPLYEMSYDAIIFFFWHNQEKGLDQLMPFLGRMAGAGDAAAQMRAMNSALSDDDWISFAEAFDDGRIRHPDGLPLSFGARIEGETWSIASDFSAHDRELRPFAIELGWADYSCGTWGNETSAQGVEVRREDGRDWGPWPQELDTENRTVRLRVIGMATSDSDDQLRLEAEKRESCVGCLVSRAIDRCVVGRWRQTGGGPMEYLRSRGVPITIANQTELHLTMNDDGTFSTNDINTDMEMETTDSHGHVLRGSGQGVTSAVQGRWSAEDGVLMGCIDSGGSPSGVTTLEAEGHSASSPWSGSVAGTGGGTSYSCSDTTFTTSAPTAQGDMTYTFTRESPPPRRR